MTSDGSQRAPRAAEAPDTETLLERRGSKATSRLAGWCRNHAQKLAIIVMLFQFGIPIVMTFHRKKTSPQQEHRVPRHALCPRLGWRDRLELPALINYLVSGNDYQFYDLQAQDSRLQVEQDAPCGRRTETGPDDHELRHRCASNLRVRERASCAAAANVLFGLDAASYSLQAHATKDSMARAPVGTLVIGWADHCQVGRKCENPSFCSFHGGVLQFSEAGVIHSGLGRFADSDFSIGIAASTEARAAHRCWA